MSYIFFKKPFRSADRDGEDKYDNASSLFDAAFATQSSSSSSTEGKPQTQKHCAPKQTSSPKKVELPTEAKSNSPSSTSFSSPTASIPDDILAILEKSDSSDDDEPSGAKISLFETPLDASNYDACKSMDDDFKKRVNEVNKEEKEKREQLEQESSAANSDGSRGCMGDAFEEEEEEAAHSPTIREGFPEFFEGSTSSQAHDSFDDEKEEEKEEKEMMPAHAKRPRFEEYTEGSSSAEVNLESTHQLFSLVGKKDNKPLYKHKWASDDEDDEDLDEPEGAKTPTPIVNISKGPESCGGVYREFGEPAQPSRRDGPIIALRSPPLGTSCRPGESTIDAVRTRVRNVKEALECMESGEEDDYEQDVEYALSTLVDPSASNYIKCLSVMSLAKRCLSLHFRNFFRTQDLFGKFTKAVLDCAMSSSLSISVATVVYLMARDRASFALDASTLRLLTVLVKVEKPESNTEYEKYVKSAWAVLEDYAKMLSASTEKRIQFDFTEDTISPSSLTLEAMVYVSFGNRTNEAVKNELHLVGILQWVVSKVDKAVLRLVHEKALSSDKTFGCLFVLERCFRILEAATVMHKKNQAYLISHRGNLLIQSCGKLISYFHSTIDGTVGTDQVFVKRAFGCLILMSRVLMNLSHENELCSSKLGQMSGCLGLCMTTCTYLAPKYGDEDSRFDLIVITCSLLVNLLERCNSNRRKLINMRVKVYSRETQTASEEPVLNALCMMFLYHDSVARIVDEDLDNDLVIEDVSEESDHEEGGEDESGRLHRMAIELTEDEMARSVETAMNKASRHMEDSMVSSYVALLIGCLLQQNEESAAAVKSMMPEGKLTPMIEQLQRFLEFMKITTHKASSCRSLERIIDLLDKLSG